MAVCEIRPSGVLCELDGFAGASVPVACGQRAVVGTACCGGCGCVPVEVFFDGRTCWQGVPACTAVPELTDQVYDPHQPGALAGAQMSVPNNGVPGDFYPAGGGTNAGGGPAAGGSGASGGSAAGGSVAGGAGGSSGGTAGAPAAGVAGMIGGGGGFDCEAGACDGGAESTSGGTTAGGGVGSP